jgi:hypothetical protein
VLNNCILKVKDFFNIDKSRRCTIFNKCWNCKLNC